MNDLERKQIKDVAVYQRPTDTSNPNVKRMRGAKTIVPSGSDQDNQMNTMDASLPNNNRYTYFMKNTPKGDDNGGT